MRGFSNRISIIAAFTLFIAAEPAESLAQTVENPGLARFEAPRPDDARERFERAMWAAQRELEEGGAPALTATFASWLVWTSAALQAEAARAARDAFEQSGHDFQTRALQDDLDEKNRAHAQIKAEAERVFDFAKSEKGLTDEQRTVLQARASLDVEKAAFEVEYSQSKLLVFTEYEAPRERRRLADQLERASEALTWAASSHQERSERLRRKMNLLRQLLSGGSAWMGRLLSNLKTGAVATAPPNGLPPNVQVDRAPQQPKPAEARPGAVDAKVSQLALASTNWFVTTSLLAKSLLVR